MAGSRAGDVVQLVRTLPCHGRGREFESRRPRHSLYSKKGNETQLYSFHAEVPLQPRPLRPFVIVGVRYVAAAQNSLCWATNEQKLGY
jgi:hypothetical protein